MQPLLLRLPASRHRRPPSLLQPCPSQLDGVRCLPPSERPAAPAPPRTRSRGRGGGSSRSSLACSSPSSSALCCSPSGACYALRVRDQTGAGGGRGPACAAPLRVGMDRWHKVAFHARLFRRGACLRGQEEPPASVLPHQPAACARLACKRLTAWPTPRWQGPRAAGKADGIDADQARGPLGLAAGAGERRGGVATSQLRECSELRRAAEAPGQHLFSRR